jgi:hypothetical protein
MSFQLSPDTERIVAAHLADPALVRRIIEAHVLGLSLPCTGIGADGRCHCGEEEDAAEKEDRR